jgi:hypothetical protein
LKTSNLILDFEFDQHLESHKHEINIIMWFRDMVCYKRCFVVVFFHCILYALIRNIF